MGLCKVSYGVVYRVIGSCVQGCMGLWTGWYEAVCRVVWDWVQVGMGLCKRVAGSCVQGGMGLCTVW